MNPINRSTFLRGFRAVLPLWLAAAPFALVYVIAAQRAGLSPSEIQIMSLTVYSAAAQIALVQLLAIDASFFIILVTMLIMHLHFLMYGLSLSKHIVFSRFERIFLPFFLTDVAYGMTVAESRNTKVAFLLGAEFSIYLGWNLFTALAILLGDRLINPAWDHLDFIASLTFFALLVMVTRSWFDSLVALFAMILTLICVSLGLGSVTLLVVVLITMLCVLLVSRFQEEHTT